MEREKKTKKEKRSDFPNSVRNQRRVVDAQDGEEENLCQNFTTTDNFIGVFGGSI